MNDIQISKTKLQLFEARTLTVVFDQLDPEISKIAISAAFRILAPSFTEACKAALKLSEGNALDKFRRNNPRVVCGISENKVESCEQIEARIDAIVLAHGGIVGA